MIMKQPNVIYLKEAIMRECFLYISKLLNLIAHIVDDIFGRWGEMTWIPTKPLAKA